MSCSWRFPLSNPRSMSPSNSSKQSGESIRINKFKELIEDEIVEDQQAQEMEEEFNLDSLIFEILPLTTGIQGITQMPIALNVDAQKQKGVQRAALDLICVVDVSGSMSGEKLDLIKESLRYIQKILSSQDRISIITFQNYSKLEISLTRNSEQRKQFIKESIMNMKADGGTNISAGLDQALRLIAHRKYRNPITTIFLLSDGQNSNGNPVPAIENLLKKYNIQEPFDLACFGYGADHDAKALDSIAQLKQGTFTYIKDIQRACEYFILSMSSMLSVGAQKVEILVRSNYPYRIIKFYGEDQMITKLEENNYQLSQNYVLSGQSRQYLFILEWEEGQNEEVSVVATFKGQSMNDEDIFKQAQLILKYGQADMNQFVELNYLRAKAGDSIEQARQLAGKKQFDEANQVLDTILNEIVNSPQSQSKQLQNVLKDLERSKEVCNPKNFQKEGEAVLRKNMRHHIQRQRSASYSASWDSDQQYLMCQYQSGKLQLSRSASPEEKSINNRRSQNSSKSRSLRQRRQPAPASRSPSSPQYSLYSQQIKSPSQKSLPRSPVYRQSPKSRRRSQNSSRSRSPKQRQKNQRYRASRSPSYKIQSPLNSKQKKGRGHSSSSSQE